MSSHAAVIPVPKLEEDSYDWYARHAEKQEEARRANHELVLIGDSITHFWGGSASRVGNGEAVYAELFRPYRTLNLGFGWDRTQNVLYRLAHGEFDGQTPKLIVINIGTNNLTGTNNAPTSSPAEIVDGIAAICRELLTRSPLSRILIMCPFPRSTPADPLRERIRELALLLRDLAAAHWQLRFLDIGADFLQPDGTIPTTLMSDLCHPTAAGYQIWATALRPILADVFGSRT